MSRNVCWSPGFCENKGGIREGSADSVTLNLILPTKIAQGSHVKHLGNRDSKHPHTLDNYFPFLNGKFREKLTIKHLTLT